MEYVSSLADAGRLGRIGVRRLRTAVRSAVRPEPDWTRTLGPVRLRVGELTLRAPRIGDAAEWRAARLANRRWLEPLFPADVEDWADGQGRAQWTERCLRLRAAARTARAFPYVLLLNGRLVGEIGVDAVDRGTQTGELSVWSDRTVRSGQIVLTGAALVILRAFTAAHPVQRIVAPVAVDNRAPVRSLRALGFTREATMPRLRETGGRPADHDIWVLHHTPEAVRTMRSRAATSPTPRPSVRN